LDPMEVVFIKYKRAQKWWPSQQRAALYTLFNDQSVPLSEPLRSLETKRTIGHFVVDSLLPFFDVDYYVSSSRDLHVLTGDALVCHFVTAGFIEARPFRLVSTCGSTRYGGADANPATSGYHARQQEECKPRYPLSRASKERLLKRCGVMQDVELSSTNNTIASVTEE